MTADQLKAGREILRKKADLEHVRRQYTEHGLSDVTHPAAGHICSSILSECNSTIVLAIDATLDELEKKFEAL